MYNLWITYGGGGPWVIARLLQYPLVYKKGEIREKKRYTYVSVSR